MTPREKFIRFTESLSTEQRIMLWNILRKAKRRRH